jgi:endonuclease/exonuclease/phosphatase family metal-dependent hydrolase
MYGSIKKNSDGFSMKRNNLLFCFLLLLSALFGYGQPLKVMTYNIRLDVASDGENDWAHRKEFFMSQIRFYEPDIIGVQEATPGQVVDMASALPQYGRIGIGRDGNNLGEASCIYYKKDRFIVSDTATFWLSETPDTVSKGWDAAINRVCTYGRFRDKKAKRSFRVFNTHLDHKGEVARTKGIELILSRINAVSKKDEAVIFMGDLNSEPGADRILALKTAMDDSRDISEEKPFGPSGTFNGFKHQEPVTVRIDYIFLSKNKKMKVKKYAVLSDSDKLRYPSDHLPVFVELTYQ